MLPLDNEPLMLTRYEIARVLGLRALQLENGCPPSIVVKKNEFPWQTAMREILAKKLDVIVVRGDTAHHINDCTLPYEAFVSFDAEYKSSN